MKGLNLPPDMIKKSPKSTRKAPIILDHGCFGEHGGPHVSEMKGFKEVAGKVAECREMLIEGKSGSLKDGPVAMTGWKTKSPFIPGNELDTITSAAKKLSSQIDDLWSIGIGGSYLGIRAAIEAVRGGLETFNMLSREERGGSPRIFFLGQNMDPSYTAGILSLMKGRNVGGNVISKSGGTVEPAIAFAVMKSLMEASYSENEAAERIVAITDAKKGSLRQLAGEKGYKTYIVSDDVGGRFSVTCPAGLFTLAAAGVDIKEFIEGARFAEGQARELPFDKNIPMLRAAMRFMAHKKMGKDIEVASTGIYDLRSTTSWMQQLGPESEGKDGEGMWISPEYYTEMAHANGQMIQMGKRNLIETFLMLDDPGTDVIIPAKGTPVEYLDGQTLHFANSAFIKGLRDAHYEGGVPVMSYILPDLSAYTMGMFFQTEMNAIALSGLMLGQNPFIQPGVQLYKEKANSIITKRPRS